MPALCMAQASRGLTAATVKVFVVLFVLSMNMKLHDPGKFCKYFLAVHAPERVRVHVPVRTGVDHDPERAPESLN